MSFFTSFRNMLKVGMEEDDDEETDRKYDEYRERNAKNADERNVKGAGQRQRSSQIDEDDEEEDDYNAGGQYVQKQAQGHSIFGRSTAQNEQKVVPIMKARTLSMEKISIVRPVSLDDFKQVIDTVKREIPVIINFSGLMKDESSIAIAQKFMDYVSGGCYALDGKFCQITKLIVLAVPESVEVSGDDMNKVRDTFGDIESNLNNNIENDLSKGQYLKPNSMNMNNNQTRQ